MTAGRITVLTVDDHPLMREGLARVLEADEQLQWIGEADSGPEAVAMHRRLRPDVTLLDIQMPGMNGIETLICLREEFPQTRVIVLSAYRGAPAGRRSLRAGAAGYVPKSITHGELQKAIRVVHSGHPYISADLARDLASDAEGEELTGAETDVLRLVAAGFSNKRVGARLQIPEETVKSRMKSIARKLSALDRTHAVSLALIQGIIEMD